MNRTRFADHATEWLAEKADATRVTTWRDYESVVRIHLLPAWGARRVKTISSEDVSALFATVGDLRTAKVRAVVKQLLPDVEVPKVRSRRWRPQAVPSPSEVKALAEVAPWGGDLILAAAYTGLRWGELAALQVGSVDQGKRQIQVSRAAPATTRKVEGPKTRNSARTAVYGEGLNTTETFLGLGLRMSSELVFTSPRGSALHHSNFRKRVWLPALETTCLSFRFHDLRHTYATLLIGGGVPLAMVAQMMGHSSPRVTLDVYAGHFGELDQVAAALAW